MVAQILGEALWAWRSVRARAPRVALSAAIVGLSLGTATLVFSAADSLVFRRVPYADPERLVEIRRAEPRGGDYADPFLSAPLLEEWRKQKDLFVGVHGYLTKTVFLTDGIGSTLVQCADVTVGLIDLLGVQPRWGRLFVTGEDGQVSPQPVLIAEQLARARFGDPAHAVGRHLETTAHPLVVVGVMPDDFRFPNGTQQIWRALDPRGELARGFVGTISIARLVPGARVDLVQSLVQQRSTDIGLAAGRQGVYRASIGPLGMARTQERQRAMSFLLLAAALCLVLIACANVASLELTDAIQRARSYAILLSLGASRATLSRATLFECGYVMVLAGAIGTLTAVLGSMTLANYLPERLVAGVVNRIDLDSRAFLFMLATAVVTWCATALPVVFFASGTRIPDLLKSEGHTAGGSRLGALVRGATTVAQVAIAVWLLTVGAVFVLSYATLLRDDKGFDSIGVAQVTVTIPPQFYRSAETQALARELVERVRPLPGVLGATDASAPPSVGYRSTFNHVEIDGGDLMNERLMISEIDVPPEYFSVLRIPLLAGRYFADPEPPTNVIIGEVLAKRFWPAEEAVGRRFRLSPGRGWYDVIGVARHVRTTLETASDPSTHALQIYLPRRPAPMLPATSPAAASGASYGLVNLTVRVDSPRRLENVVQIVRQSAGRFKVDAELADDRYDRRFEDVLLTTRILGSFGVLAFAVAAAGVYGVMMLLVTRRRREIGIRVALGASRRIILRLVLGSSLRLVITGAVLGIAAAIAGSKWVESQLYGASGISPLVLGSVVVSVVSTAMIATLHPARIAARVDPSTLLRAE